MRRFVRTLLRDPSGSVAPTVALSLIALIAAGGVAFDYARMASMDTELQNAADQAALAAASQLDAQPGACARAAAAARNMITNLTYMANDGSNESIVIANEPACDATGKVRFYQNIAKTTPATLDANAKFVEVQVDSRTAFYALTPIVNAMSSGAVYAQAFAGLGEATCRVPPLMMCNPNEATDPDFTVANYVGKGMRLVANDGNGTDPGGGPAWGPGLFGFLEVGQGNGVPALLAVLGRQGDPGNCSEGTGVEPNSGNMQSVRDAFNVRFDMDGTGLNQACGANGDLCPPSINSRKDLLRHQTGCTFTQNNNGWKEPPNVYPNRPTDEAPHALSDAEVQTVAPMGYPRDICHAFSKAGSCTPNALMGDANWDRYAYFRSHSLTTPANWDAPQNDPMTNSFDQWLQNTFGTTTPTRFQVYKHEMANSATRLQAVTDPSGLVAHGTPICNPPGITPGTNTLDRRILSVAVLNCTANSVGPSSDDVPVQKWIDIFLVEPAVARARTENHDVYIEIIGESANAIEAGNFQVVKKSVPYLIE